MTLRGRFLIPPLCLTDILCHTITMLEVDAHVVLSPFITLIGGFSKPSHSLGIILRDTFPIFIHGTEISLCQRKSLVGSHTVPSQCLGIIFRDAAPAHLRHPSERILRLSITLTGRFHEPLHGLREIVSLISGHPLFIHLFRGKLRLTPLRSCLGRCGGLLFRLSRSGDDTLCIYSNRQTEDDGCQYSSDYNLHCDNDILFRTKIAHTSDIRKFIAAATGRFGNCVKRNRVKSAGPEVRPYCQPQPSGRGRGTPLRISRGATSCGKDFTIHASLRDALCYIAACPRPEGRGWQHRQTSGLSRFRRAYDPIQKEEI